MLYQYQRNTVISFLHSDSNLIILKYNKKKPQHDTQRKNILLLFLFTFQVGACIVNEENKIVGIGYNGMPIGCHDDLMPWGREHSDVLQTKQLYGMIKVFTHKLRRNYIALLKNLACMH